MSSLIRRLNSLRQDLWRAARGQGQKATVQHYAQATGRRQPPPQPVALATTAMRVTAVTHETPSAISLTLVRQDGADIEFLPGMFFTLVLNIAGREHRRAYSISSAATLRTSATITIKRVPDGLVSQHLVDTVAVGASLNVLGPAGAFTLRPQAGRQRELLLIGGGSGITPLMAILRSVLAIEADSRITLFYANRRRDEIIFADELDALVRQYRPRLRLLHVLEEAPAAWSGACGRLDVEQCTRLLTQAYGEDLPADLRVFQCGPAPMMEAVRTSLLAQGLAAEHLQQENFLPGRREQALANSVAQPLTIVAADGQRWQGYAAAGQSLLDAGLALQAPMNFSCTLGGCGRCRVRVLSGSVAMPGPHGLLPEEEEAGYALACIATASSPLTIAIAPPTPL